MRIPSKAWSIALLAVLGACAGAGGAGIVGIGSLHLSPGAATIHVGETTQITAVALGPSGEQVTGLLVTFTSDNDAVATTTAAGLVTAVAPGSATITARAGSALATAVVTVVPREAAVVSLDHDSLDMASGASVQVAVTATDATGAVLQGATIVYTSSDAKVFTVSAAGAVLAVGSGVATLTATSGSAHAGIPVVVYRPFSGELQSASVPGRPFGVTIAPDGLLYVTEQDGNALARFQLPGLLANGAVNVGVDPGEVIFTHDGLRAYSVNVLAGTISVVSVAQGATVGTFTLNRSALRARLSSDDSRLFVGMDDGTVRELDPVTGVARDTIQALGGAINGLALSPDGAHLYATSTVGGVADIDTKTNALARTIPLAGALQDIAVSPDGSRLYVAVEGAGVTVLNTASGSVSTSVALPSAFGIALSPLGYYLAVTDSTTGTVSVFDRVLMRRVATYTPGGTLRRVAFGPSGTTLAVASEQNVVYLIH